MVTLTTILGAIALVGGGSTYFTYEPGLKMGLDAMLNLKENGMVYPLYMTPPVPSISKFFLYEAINPREFLVGKKLRFKVRGPYVYEAWIWRDNISFSEGQKMVTYDSHRTLKLREDLSENLDERFWILNPIFVGVQKSVKEMVLDKVPFRRVSEPIVFNSVNVLLDNFKERLFVKKSPRDLLDGNKVRILEMITALADRFGAKSLLPPGPPEDIFGLAFAQNKIVDNLEIHTGVGEPKKFGDVLKWKGKQRLTQWEGRCNNIEGTNGELYKPFPKVGKPIKVFLSQVCRSFTMDPISNGSVTVQDGLLALEYEVSKKIFQGARSNPNNKCFCKNTKTYDCQYDGFLFMGPCFFDSPLYFSRPNYNGLDRRIRSLMDEDSVDSLNLPDKQSFWLEPITGTVLKVNLTLIGNFKVVRQPYMRDLAKVQNLTYSPLFAINESIELPYKVTWQLKLLQKMVQYHKPAAIMMATAGAGTLAMTMLFRRRASTTQSSDTRATNQIATP